MQISNDDFTLQSVSISPSAKILADISIDGRVVQIDWREVNKVLNEPKTDAMIIAFARLMMAIRNGTWVAMKEKPHDL